MAQGVSAQNCSDLQSIGKIGFVLYKCQQHQLIEVIKAVLHDDADPAACVMTIEDGHSLLSPFEHLASFSLQYRAIAHLINKTAVLKDTDINEVPFLRSSRILGVFLQASDSAKVVSTRWSFENCSEVWLADNRILTPSVVKSILALPGVQKIRSLNKPLFLQLLLPMTGRASRFYSRIMVPLRENLSVQHFAIGCNSYEDFSRQTRQWIPEEMPLAELDF